jgi:hypothetical protein
MRVIFDEENGGSFCGEMHNTHAEVELVYLVDVVDYQMVTNHMGRENPLKVVGIAGLLTPITSRFVNVPRRPQTDDRGAKRRQFLSGCHFGLNPLRLFD